MPLIKKLTPEVINKIAAGEVIESGHSIVKELIENSLDAGATRIEIESNNGGLEKIVISDDGSGILPDDLDLLLERHSTSKIADIADMEDIFTYGFRGEALSSVASIARMTIQTGISHEQPAYTIKSENGMILEKKESRPFKGTKIEIDDLFYNTPVRRKFIKSEKLEDRKIKDRVAIAAMSHPFASFKLIQNGKIIFNLQPEDQLERIVSIFGEQFRDHLLAVNLERRGISATGFISDSDLYRSNRMGQYIFVNGRDIEIKYSSVLLKKSYGELLPTGAHPWCFLFFTINPRHIDVNVHPTKKEIRFLDEQGFHGFFFSMLQLKLHTNEPVGFSEFKKNIIQNKPENIPQSNFQQILHQDIFPSPLMSEGYNVENTGAGIEFAAMTANASRREFIPKKHFGLLFRTYIIAEAEDGLYIIDQHTAHERIRYEEILKVLRKKNYNVQPLLTPIKIDLSKDDCKDLLALKVELTEAGILIEEFGEGSLVIREIPNYIDPGREKEIILDFFERIKTERVEIFDEMAKSVACRTAIKKGDYLSDHILAEILNRLSYCENPSRCPHGRPTLIKITKEDLDKMFYRIR